MKSHQKGLLRITIFIVLFFGLWILRQYIYVYVDNSLQGYAKTFFGIGLKIIYWIGLVYAYSRIVYKENPFKKLSFKNNSKGILWAGIFGVLLLASNLLLNKVRGLPVFSLDFSIRGFLSAAIAAPLIEEFVFRGFILSKLSDNLPFLVANAITAILFTAAHFPGWIIWGNGISIISALSILMVSFIWGYFYKKSQSFWSPVVAHSLNNIVTMIV